MSADRKKKPRQRAGGSKKRRQPDSSRKWLSGKEVSIQGEVDYIVSWAQQGEARVVTLGMLVFFSTETGDAWMLEPEGGLALCLARSGEPQPVRIEETETTFGIGWNRGYVIDGNAFCVFDPENSRTTAIMGYPMQEVLAAIERQAEEKAGWRKP